MSEIVIDKEAAQKIKETADAILADQTSPVMESCANCRYALPMPTGRMRCRRNPPIASIVHDSWDPTNPDKLPKMLTFFPSVQNIDWCGQWEPEREHETRTLGVGPLAAPPVTENEIEVTAPETQGEKPPVDDPGSQPPEEDPAEKRKREADKAAGVVSETALGPLEEVPASEPSPIARRLQARAKVK